MNPTFPFAGLVGQEQLKLCLALAAVDWRLSCLIRGDKGSGKSTAARGLAQLLPCVQQFINVPIAVTEDRLLGGLNLERAFEGKAALKPGLVHEAKGGVLYIDEVNLLAGHLTDALLDVTATGRYVLERDGFSQSYEARFVLVGSMNQEEGSLRPQLLDRFALALDVHAPSDPAERIAVIQARQCFDEHPDAFVLEAEAEQVRWRDSIAAAREKLARVTVTEDHLRHITEAITSAGVRSLRADLAAVRAAAALAALERRVAVQTEDVERVLPLVLLHRAVDRPPSSPPPQPPDRHARKEEQETTRPQAIRVFVPEPKSAPRLRPAVPANQAAAQRPQPDAPADLTRIDVFSSLLNSAKNGGGVALQPEYIVHKKARPDAATRYVFVVDCSGSQAARQKMRAVKGVALALIQSSFHSGDEIAVIAFRGPGAQVLVEPSKDVALIERQMELVATGGRTPLAGALECASRYLDGESCLVLFTDGRANDDSSRAGELAGALGATLHRLDEVGESGLLELIRRD